MRLIVRRVCDHHPHVLPLWGGCDDPRAPCLITPLQHGGNLEDRLMPTAAGNRRLAMLGLAPPPPPLTVAERVRVMRDMATALVYLHSVVPGVKARILHCDVKPSNILLDEKLHATLADVGIAKLAPDAGQTQGGGAASAHVSTVSVRGTPGLLDPLSLNGLQHSPLSDGYAFGMTLLVALTGHTAVGLHQKCRLMIKHPDTPARWCAPGVPDAKAGAWADDVACGLMGVVCGLTEMFKEDRIGLDEALRELECVLASLPLPTAHPPPAGSSSADAPAPAPARPPSPLEEDGSRFCLICDARPRTVRFSCGHSCCCDMCARRVAASDNLCPMCRAPLGAPLEHGAHVSGAPSFLAQPASGRGAGRGAGRGGRGRGGPAPTEGS